jgi:acetylornithine deacetylase/succinyl-diaminopimelate desuccinylase-like protein
MTKAERLIEDAIAICRVPAPTGREGHRAEFVLDLFRREGLRADLDRAGNVVAELDGDPSLPAVAVAAHLDTVFPDEEPIEVRREAGVIHAPGIGDNSAGVAALLALARHLPRSGIGRVLLVATVGEEGLGDLAGMKALIEERGSDIDLAVALEGAMRDRIVTRGIGSERLRFTVRGPGGHSWGDAGAPSAILGVSRLVEALHALDLPDSPKTTLSVGTIHGGQSINSIPAKAAIEVDLRSLDQRAVLELRDRAIAAAANLFPGASRLHLDTEAIGSRPAGALSPGHPVLSHVAAARREAGLAPAAEIASSTDANIPLALGIPAICVGVGHGEDAHRRTELLREDGIVEGLDALLGLVGRAAADPALVRGGRPS